MHRIFIALGFIIFSLTVQAKEFKNSYLAFDLPERWSCLSEGTEFICKVEPQRPPNDAIIIFTAKETGPSDTLESYEAYLKQAKTIPDIQGKPTSSQAKQILRKTIGGHQWVDGLHMGSEIPNYYTRYLATVKGRIAILVTFSAHASAYTRYSSDFAKSIESLRIVATPDMFQPKGASTNDNGEIIGAVGSFNDPNAVIDPSNAPGLEPTGPAKKRQQLFLFAIIIAALGAYVFIKFRK